jgi:putative OPT family oligopeptide transporter
MSEPAAETKEFLGINSAGKTAEQIELEWFENHYHGEIPQLTVRAVVMGSILGCVMSLSNLYIGLKTGWGLGVAITACILSYSIGTVLAKVGVLKSNLTILENNAMQSTASSAGYSTGGAMVSAISAMLMIRGQHMPFATLLLWTIFLAILGVVLAIPMKRQMVNVEQLRFPSGVAAAETLRSLYATGAAATKKARSLGAAGLLGVVITWLRDNTFPWWPTWVKIPSTLEFPGMLVGQKLAQWTISFEMSAIMVAAGAIIGIRTAWSMLLGAIVNYGVLAPRMYELGAIQKLGYRGIVAWSLWGGASLMVTSGLLAFAFQWRTIGRAFSGLANVFGGRPSVGTRDPRLEAMDKVEVPGSWFLLGLAVATAGVVTIMVVSFSIAWWMGLISVLMTFFLAVVACRATGETDITPIGAMGKIVQLTYGILAPANMTTNLMTACVTAGAASSSADLLTDLKSGYLLGANPRKQFLAQFFGIFPGAIVITTAFYLLVPTADVLGSDKFPAPAAQVWKGVAELLANGLSSLHITARWALAIGGLLGLLIPTLEKLFPKARPYIPSAMGLGLALVIPFFNTLSMFIGAVIAWVLAKVASETAELYTIPVASGIIAGESLMGVAVALLAATGVMTG